MQKILRWLSGPFPKWGTLAYLAAQFILFWLAVDQPDKHSFWNGYAVLLTLSLLLVLVKTVVRLALHGRRSILFNEPDEPG